MILSFCVKSLGTPLSCWVFPGNILSAIVWLRLHVASRNSSGSVFLAALAINDFAYLLFQCILYYTDGMMDSDGWLCQYAYVIIQTTTVREPLLVLGFSVERLIAISWPFQVGLTYITYIPFAFSFGYNFCVAIRLSNSRPYVRPWAKV